tara:strand:- start:21301 stop:22179 length:879 start_codon:yes stop_codon:yes gene_type:complete
VAIIVSYYKIFYMTAIQPVIFTDMDGSLLDHATYSHAEADELLDWLRSRQIPVIPVTSKTRAEVLVLRKQLKNDYPFVVENGAAIFSPLGYFKHDISDVIESDSYFLKAFVNPRTHWQSLLGSIGPHLNDAFVTFAQAGVSGVMEMTGLANSEARLASQREFGEPLKWLGSSEQFELFNEYIVSHGGQLLRGGRFIHLSGRCDKGLALRWLLAEYQQHYPGKKIVTIALGDSHNDTAMLEAADYAVVIRSPVHDYPKLKHDKQQHVYLTREEGPRGWVEGVTNVLNDLGKNN